MSYLGPFNGHVNGACIMKELHEFVFRRRIAAISTDMISTAHGTTGIPVATYKAVSVSTRKTF
jgi:hypothetical protein